MEPENVKLVRCSFTEAQRRKLYLPDQPAFENGVRAFVRSFVSTIRIACNIDTAAPQGRSFEVFLSKSEVGRGRRTRWLLEVYVIEIFPSTHRSAFATAT